MLDEKLILQERVDELESKVYELELLFSELSDEMGSKIAEEKFLTKARSIAESLIVEAFELKSADILYWVNYKVYGLDNSGRQTSAHVMLYYLLFSHVRTATMLRLEEIYGYNPIRMEARFARLDLTPEFHNKRLAIERSFLDQIGLPAEPISTGWPRKAKLLALYKNKCRAESKPYRRSACQSL